MVCPEEVLILRCESVCDTYSVVSLSLICRWLKS